MKVFLVHLLLTPGLALEILIHSNKEVQCLLFKREKAKQGLSVLGICQMSSVKTDFSEQTDFVQNSLTLHFPLVLGVFSMVTLLRSEFCGLPAAFSIPNYLYF